MTQFFIGIDGGGTTTTAVIVNAAGQEIARSRGGTSNPSVVGLGETARVLTELVGEVRFKANITEPIAKGWAGLAGFGRNSDHESLRTILQSTILELRLTNDVELVLAGLRGNIGVALISGTGSIAAGRNLSGDFVRVGGWGHILGDEGSGYGIGRDALTAVSRAIDGRGPETSLTSLIFDALEISDPFDLITRVYDPSMDKAAIAGFAQYPIDQVHCDDPVSVQIVINAVENLASMVSTTARRLGFTEKLQLAMTGGILMNSLLVSERVLKRLREDWTSVDPVMVVDPALSAARSLAGFWGYSS